MKVTDVRYINPINTTESGIVISDTNRVSATNEYDVVLNVYDSFDNFLFRKNYKNGRFPLEFQNELQYLQSLKQLVTSEGFNESGIYKFRYHFVDDIFDSLTIANNKFIVTEISSDRTEVRLNPFSKQDFFINKFNNFKQYVEIKSQVNDINILVNEVIKRNINNFYKDENIDTILNNLTFFEGGIVVDLFVFLRPFYSVGQIENILAHLKESFLSTKDIVENKIKKIIVENQTIKNLISSYNENPNPNTVITLQENIFTIFKKNISTIVTQEIVLLFDVDTEPTKEIDILIYGCTDPTAINWNISATQDDGSCVYEEPETGGGSPIYGCDDPDAINYDPDANTNDGSCVYEDEETPVPPSPITPGDPETGGPLPIPPSKFGDVNSDGFIDDGDANLTLQGVVGNLQLTAYQRYLADVAEPYGKLNSADALAIAQKTGKTGQVALREDEFNNQNS
jgi:hypothetical protein